MSVFISLEPSGVVEGFDAEKQGCEPMVSIEECNQKIVVSYIFPGFLRNQEQKDVNGTLMTFDHVDIPSAGHFAQNGKPLLPSFGRYVQIPFNCDHEVSVARGREIVFDDFHILPSQEHLTDDPDEETNFEMDQSCYDLEDEYGDILETQGPYSMDGYNALLIHVRPLRTVPGQKKLIGCANITVTITLKERESDAEDVFDVLADPAQSTRAYGNLILNPARRIESRIVVRPIIEPIHYRFHGSEYLIIYHSVHKSAAERLAKWKRLKGITTETIDINKIGNSVGEIKNYIRNKRKIIFNRIRYVMLFGDTNQIVSEVIAGGPWGSNMSDYYYSTPKDPASATDCVKAWISIGRIPTRTSGEGNVIVDQIIRYEKYPPSDPDYYERMTFAAYFQDNHPQDGKADRSYMQTMESIRSHMVSLGFDVQRVYVSNNPNPQKWIDGTPIPPSVKASIVNGTTATQMLKDATAEGQLVIGHRDHGNWDGWSHPSFKKSDLGGVTTLSPSIFYSINCLTGKFDLAGATDSFAEEILEKNGATPSLVAATRVSHTWLNNDLIKALFDAMWPGVIPTFPGTTVSYSVKNNRLGDILNYAKAYLPVKMSGGSNYIKDHYEIYHVVGDPTLELWKATPLNIQIKIAVRKSTLIISLSHCPSRGLLSIWHGNKKLKSLTPSSRLVSIPIKELQLLPQVSRRVITICLAAPGYRFRQKRVYI